MNFTTKNISEGLDMKQLDAYNLVRFLEDAGVAERVGTLKTGGRGRPTVVYQMTAPEVLPKIFAEMARRLAPAQENVAQMSSEEFEAHVMSEEFAPSKAKMWERLAAHFEDVAFNSKDSRRKVARRCARAYAEYPEARRTLICGEVF